MCGWLIPRDLEEEIPATPIGVYRDWFLGTEEELPHSECLPGLVLPVHIKTDEENNSKGVPRRLEAVLQ